MKDSLREIVREWFGYVVTSYWGGFLLIIVAIYGMIYMCKERNDEINQGSEVYYLGCKPKGDPFNVIVLTNEGTPRGSEVKDEQTKK